MNEKENMLREKKILKSFQQSKLMCEKKNQSEKSLTLILATAINKANAIFFLLMLLLLPFLLSSVLRTKMKANIYTARQDNNCVM